MKRKAKAEKGSERDPVLPEDLKQIVEPFLRELDNRVYKPCDKCPAVTKAVGDFKKNASLLHKNTRVLISNAFKEQSAQSQSCEECQVVVKAFTDVGKRAAELHSATRAKISRRILQHSTYSQDSHTASTALSVKLFFGGILLSIILYLMATVFPNIEPVNTFHEVSLLAAKCMPVFGLALIFFLYYNISSLVYRELVYGTAGTELDDGSWTVPRRMVAQIKFIVRRKFFSVWGLDFLYTLGWVTYFVGYFPIVLTKPVVNIQFCLQASIIVLSYFVLGVLLHKLAKDMEDTVRNLAFRRYPERIRMASLEALED